MRSALFLVPILFLSAELSAQDELQHVRVLREGPYPGRYLEWRGKPILPVGDSVTQGWMELGKNFDQRAYLDALAVRGINVTLLWTYIGTSSDGQKSDARIGYDAPEIWPWEGSREQKNFNLLRFNVAYFDRLHEFAKYAESKGILVVLTVQDGWTKTKFSAHPWNRVLGNGPLTDRRQFVELADDRMEMPETYDAGWDWPQANQYFQERFAARLCAELKDCSNVIFEMFNEGEWYDPEQRRRHEEHFLAFFRRRTTAPLMTNMDHIRSAKFKPRQLEAADILSVHKQPWTGHHASLVREFLAEPPRVVFESEPVPSFDGLEPADESKRVVTLDVLRDAIWERLMAGIGFVAQNDTSFGWDKNSAMAAKTVLRDAAYDRLGHAARFFNRSGVSFWEMAPQRALASTGMCLAREGIEYVIYAPASGEFTVDLRAANEKVLAVRWMNPDSGEFHDGAADRGGSAAQRFSAPFPGPAVLHLKPHSP